MQEIEVIHKLKEPATAVMIEKKIPASILIAEAIYFLLSSKGYRLIHIFLEINNPYGIEIQRSYKVSYYRDATTGTCYKKFDSLESGISNYVTINEASRFNKIKGYYRYTDALQKDETLSVEKFRQLRDLIEGYRLADIDTAGLSKRYASKKNIVEIQSSNPNTLFYQKQCNCAPNKEKLTPQVLMERAKKEEENRQKKKLERGSKVTVRNANLYADPYSKKAIRSVTGTYYIGLGKIVNNRCGLIMKPSYVGQLEMVFGYIDISQIK